MQRTQFVLETGVNRPGPPADPLDVVVPSAAREWPKGATIAGAQVRIVVGDIGNGAFLVGLQGTNQPDPDDRSAPDPDALWLPASLPALPFSADLGLGARMLNPVTQLVTLAPFLFVRANLLVTDGALSTVDDLRVLVHVKTDYRTG